MEAATRYREVLLAAMLLAVLLVAGWWLTEGGFRMDGLRVAGGQEAGLVAVSHADCERPRLTGVAQPVNAASALGLVAVGLAVLAAVGWARGRAAPRLAQRGQGVPLAVAIITVGVGSVAFHRSATPWASWLEAVGITAIALWWLAFNLRRRWLLLGGLALAAPLLWLLPSGGGQAVQVAAIALAAASEPFLWRRRQRRWLAMALAAFAAGIVVWALSRLDGPWCDPESLLQGHGAWHLLAALGLALGVRYLWSEA